MYIFEFAALGAALCWAIGGIVSVTPSRHLGAIQFNRLRMSMVFVMLAAIALVTGGFQTVQSEHLLPIFLSAFVGIFLGDSAIFLTLNRLGPRRTSMIFSTNAPMAALLSYLFLGEHLSLQNIIGILIVLAGVVLSIMFGKRKSQLHHWEEVRGPLWIGIGLGLLAALSQAIGSLVARPVMEAGTDPIAVAAYRVGIAAFFLNMLVMLPFKELKPANPWNPSILRQIAFSGFIAMGVGMTLLLFALRGGEVGIVSTLSATSPALALPLLWIRTGEIPAIGAWLGAALVVVGSAMLFG